jgi:nucleotide-binding universal stress UspA family protein
MTTLFRRIAVAHDGSDPARAALELAFRIAAGTQAEVRLVHVLEEPDPYPELAQVAPALERMVELAGEEWRERLAAEAARAPAGVAASAEVLVAARPAGALVEYLEANEVDLLCLGTHGVGGIKPVVLGSVSHHLLHHAPCSVLLTRGESPDRAPCVVAALDRSPLAAAVAAAGQAVAAALSAELALVHVVEPLPGFVDRGGLDGVRDWLVEQGRDVLRAERDRLTAPLEHVSEHVLEGTAREELVAFCERRRAALAVVGHRGRHGFAGLLLGGTARHLVDHLTCPVLVVRDG